LKINKRAIRKVTSGEPLTEHAMRKKYLFYTKNTYILKLLLNDATARSEEPVVSGNKFLSVCAMKVY
jgi:hypothetical protein